jgi:hypothetical protein
MIGLQLQIGLGCCWGIHTNMRVSKYDFKDMTLMYNTPEAEYPDHNIVWCGEY